jgi:transcriptional/translational regulatory protein YebC/TACO1
MLSGRTDCTWADLSRRLAGEGCALSAGPDAWLEGYGPKGTVLLLLCAAPDPPSTRAAIKSLFHKRGGQLGAPGSIAYLFRSAGVIRYPPGTDAQRLAQLAYAAGAEEVAGADGGPVEVLTDPALLARVSAHLSAHAGGMAQDQRVLWRTETAVPLTGDDARSMLQLLLELEDRDDVRSVYSNAQIPDEIVAEL